MSARYLFAIPLYVATPEAIYMRRVKLTGIDPAKEPVKPPNPRL